MNRSLITAAVALAALPVFAQQQQTAAPAAPPQKIVASINGEVITLDKLNALYDRLGAQMRAQYEKTGGKAAFLENYLRKRLVVQEALKSGFDKRPEVQQDVEAAKEATLFDRYVRDVVSAHIVTDNAVRTYFDEHPDEFRTSEQAKIRHIVITVGDQGPLAKTKEQALAIVRRVAAELHVTLREAKPANPTAAAQLTSIRFAEAARRYSEDGARESGGDLGWVGRGLLDPQFEEAAFAMEPGVISGVVETPFGYHLILVEEKKPAGMERFEDVKSTIREFLMTQHAADVMTNVTRLTNELRAASKISVYPENLK